jgi:hypothetical protein
MKQNYKSKYEKILEYYKLKEDFLKKIKEKYGKIDDIEFGKNFVRVYYWDWEIDYNPDKLSCSEKRQQRFYFHIYPTSLNKRHDMTHYCSSLRKKK